MFLGKQKFSMEMIILYITTYATHQVLLVEALAGPIFALGWTGQSSS
jgi:hypothetical protein